MNGDTVSKLSGDDLAAALSTFSNEQLQPLYTALTKPMSELLSVEEQVKAAHPNHKAYADLIAHHLRLFGGNSFANLGRGEGPTYREIVRDVCRSRKLKVTATMTAVEMEQVLLANLFASLPKSEQDIILAEAAERYGYSADFGNIASAMAAMAAQAGGRAAGFMLYRTGLQLTNTVSRLMLNRGLSFAGNQALVRALGIATGPIGWAISGVLAAKDIASPALRVTTPCVVLIGGTRQTLLWQETLEVSA